MQAPCGCAPVFEPHERNPQLEGINFCPLHAAAPELLVAALRLHDGFKAWMDETGYGQEGKPLPQCFISIIMSAATLDAAIAKAEER